MEQLNLFNHPSKPVFKSQQPRLKMGKDALIQWKSRIFDHQQRVNNEQPLQTTLFDLTPNHCDPESIDPFDLRLKNWQFFQQADMGDENCIYFVVDTALPLLLYVGDTKSGCQNPFIIKEE